MQLNRKKQHHLRIENSNCSLKSMAECVFYTNGGYFLGQKSDEKKLWIVHFDFSISDEGLKNPI